MLCKVSLAAWKLFADDLDLHESKQTRFKSLHECFIRELKEGARPIDADPQVMVSPCDAVVGAHGRIENDTLFQAKGFPYEALDLLGDPERVARFRDGTYVTLRLKSTMYHRFHAPYDCAVREVNYISGDTWNVNPIALARVERLFCKNERAVIDLEVSESRPPLTLVPIAAILVASLRLHFLEQNLELRYKGPNRIACDAAFTKGEEMGYFQHGSTIVVLAHKDYQLHEAVAFGDRISMGQPLLRLP